MINGQPILPDFARWSHVPPTSPLYVTFVEPEHSMPQTCFTQEIPTLHVTFVEPEHCMSQTCFTQEIPALQGYLSEQSRIMVLE